MGGLFRALKKGWKGKRDENQIIPISIIYMLIQFSWKHILTVLAKNEF